MKKGLVSVVIPTYKREPAMLRRALESVANQTYQQLEVFVVDDSPNDFPLRDAVKETVLSFESRISIRYIPHSESLGGSAARNTGIFASEGEFLAFLDDDDEWLPEKIEEQLVAFSDPKVGLVYCREYIVNAETGETKVGERNYRKGKVFRYLITDNFIGGASFVVVRREAIDRCGAFAPVRSAQDAELFLRICQKYKVAFVDKPLLNYYVNHGAERITLNPYNKRQGFEYINKKYRFYLLFHPFKKAIRLQKLLLPYQATDQKLYRKTLLKIMLLNPFRVRENLDYFHEWKKAKANAAKEKNKAGGAI